MTKNKFPDWRDYEKQVYTMIANEYPYARVVLNEHINGYMSKSQRQIDICIYDDASKISKPGIVECKYLCKKVDVSIIDSVIGKMKDVGASFAVVCSGVGFTKGAAQSAKFNKIELKHVQFEFLKDYGFVPANALPDIFMQETNYPVVFCKNCQVTNIYEVKIVRGFAEFEDVCCPQCKTVLFNTRTDGGHRVIKRVADVSVMEEQINQHILAHLIQTRESWDRRHLFFQIPIPQEELHCKICFKQFAQTNLGSLPVDYEEYVICQECYMSNRTLLIDFGRL